MSLTESRNMQRLWRNTQAAYKNWDATEDPARPTLEDLRAWQIQVSSAQVWFERDLLTLEEFEGLLELLLKREALET